MERSNEIKLFFSGLESSGCKLCTPSIVRFAVSQFCIGGFKAVEIENLCPESSTKLFEKKHGETNQLQL